jgi:hypothetical protein
LQTSSPLILFFFYKYNQATTDKLQLPQMDAASFARLACGLVAEKSSLDSDTLPRGSVVVVVPLYVEFCWSTANQKEENGGTSEHSRWKWLTS